MQMILFIFSMPRISFLNSVESGFEGLSAKLYCIMISTGALKALRSTFWRCQVQVKTQSQKSLGMEGLFSCTFFMTVVP